MTPFRGSRKAGNCGVLEVSGVFAPDLALAPVLFRQLEPRRHGPAMEALPAGVRRRTTRASLREKSRLNSKPMLMTMMPILGPASDGCYTPQHCAGLSSGATGLNLNIRPCSASPSGPYPAASRRPASAGNELVLDYGVSPNRKCRHSRRPESTGARPPHKQRRSPASGRRESSRAIRTCGARH
jgi:hypothetical protein